MTDRQIQFGTITLKTNGFNKEYYNQMLNDDLVINDSAHPNAWLINKIKELFDINVDKEATNNQIKKVNTNQQLQTIQEGLDKKITYTKSESFFTDLINAFNYTETLTRTGVNAYSNNPHSDLFIDGTGKGLITSKKEKEYEIKTRIWIEGMKHFNEFYITIILPENKKGLIEFIKNNDWGEGYQLMPEYCEIDSHCTGSDKPSIHKKELYQYILKDTHDVNAKLMYRDPLSEISYKKPETWYANNIDVYGDITNLEPFCYHLINELDKFYK